MLRSLSKQIVLAASVVAIGAGAASFIQGDAVGTAEANTTLPGLDSVRGDQREEPKGCALATWPYLPPECLKAASGEPVAPVRWVTVEVRVGENASALSAVSAQ